MMENDFFEQMDIILNELNEGANIKDVPEEKKVTSESLKKLRGNLSIVINQNNRKQVLSLQKAKKNICK